MLHGVKNRAQHCSRIKSSAWREIEGKLVGVTEKASRKTGGAILRGEKKEICDALINIYPAIHPCSLSTV